MKFIFICIFILPITCMAVTKNSLTKNAKFGMSCHYFLKKKKPSDFKLSISTEEKGDKRFTKDTLEIIINKPVEEVWNKYKKLHLKKILENSELEVCDVFSSEKNNKNDFLEEKKRIFVDMLFYPPLPILPPMKIMIALEISKIDEDEKVIEMTYLEGTPSRGWQIVKLLPINGKTKLVHEAYYLGNTPLVHQLYPGVHHEIWGEVHNKVKQFIEKN